MTRNRVAALVLCLALLMSLMPLEHGLADNGYGKTTASGVRLRKTASTSSDYWFRVPMDYVCAYTGTVEAEGVTWYRVEISNPETEDTHAYVGYLHGEFYRPLTSAELTAWSANPVNIINNTAVPVQNVFAPGSATGSITNGGVNVRELPSTRSASLFKLDKGVVVELLSIPSAADTDPWYQIRYDNHIGYVQGPFIRVLTYGNLQTSQPTATPAPGATANAGTRKISYVRLILTSAHLRSAPGGAVWEDWEEQGSVLPVTGDAVFHEDHYWYPVVYKNRDVYVRSDCVEPVYTEGGSIITPTPTARKVLGHVITTQNNVNLRLSPGGTVIQQIPNNTILPYVAEPMTVDGYTWYYVESGNVHGYVRSDCVSLYGSEVTGGAPTPTPTPAPTQTSATVTASSFGYVVTIKSGVNLRAKANGSRIAKIDKDTVLAMTGSKTTSGAYDWYPVTYSGLYGYVRGDCVRQYTEAEVAAYLARMGLSATPTPVPQSANHYVRVALDGAALRTSASADASQAAAVNTGAVLWFDQILSSNGATWYRIIYNNRQLYVLSSNVVEMTDGEYQAYIAANPGANVQTTLYAGYVRTTKSGINVRSTAGGRVILGRVDSGAVMPYTEKTTLSGYTWYRCNTSVGVGYLRSDCVVEVNADGTPTAAPTAATATAAPVGSQVEATYTTLRNGDKGTAVRNLVQELINQGYYTGQVTSSYTDAVEAAVKAFQTAKGLTADGVAGSTTQHKLFGTVPVGSGNNSDLTMTIYPAEKIDWYTGGIQELIPRGSNFKIYDVKTGIVWWAHRWAGGKHADIEPLTAADTARLCEIYGVSSASQITAKNHWQRRPCLVTIGTRTFACSLYGVPHNPEGNTIKDNNMNGQICLHFTNSRTHDSDKVDSYHTEAIQYAWENAPNGHK